MSSLRRLLHAPRAPAWILATIGILVAVWGLILNHTGGQRTEVAWLAGIMTGVALSLSVLAALDQIRRPPEQ